jgi:hypothetical protein
MRNNIRQEGGEDIDEARDVGVHHDFDILVFDITDLVHSLDQSTIINSVKAVCKYALLTRTSISWTSVGSALSNPLTSSGLLTSNLRVYTFVPLYLLSISCLSSSRTLSRRAVRTSLIGSGAAARANSIALALPIPAEAPVTSTFSPKSEKRQTGRVPGELTVLFARVDILWKVEGKREMTEMGERETERKERLESR